MKDISFQEKELKILRQAVDSATSILGEKMVKSDNIYFRKFYKKQ